MIGEPEEAIKFGEAALRLNPHHPDWYFVFLSTAMFTARRYSEAHAVRSRAPDAFIDSPFFGATTLAHMGRLDAKQDVGRTMRLPGSRELLVARSL